MVNNSTNINKTNNHLSLKESLNSDGQQLSTKPTIPLNINKTNNHLSPKESLNSDGQQFYQYQQNQQSPLT